MRKNFNRNIFLFLTLLVIGWFCGCLQKAKDNRPNILFIMSDDHGYQAISAYDSKINTTPNIDRIASEGMIFDRCYVTNSICAPARATILTGKYSHKNGVLDNHHQAFDGFQQTFPKLLQKSGYNTALVGKWHLKTTPSGFDYHEITPGQGAYYNPDFLRNGEMLQYYGYNTDVTTNIALEWLKNKREKEKPFLLMLHFKAPHTQFTPNITHAADFQDVTLPEPPTLYDTFENRASVAANTTMTIARHIGVEALKLKLPEPQRMKFHQKSVLQAAYKKENEAFEKAALQGKELLAWKYQRFVKEYIRTVESIDENVGLVLDYLKESGLEKNTVVIYTSDQGFFLGEHGYFDKRLMYEESIRVPLLASWPGVIQAGSRNDALVSNIDFAETFLDIAGISVPEDMQGRSFKEMFAGHIPSGWRTSLYYHYYEHGFHGVPKFEGVFNKNYKLINYYTTAEWELFDRSKDPLEMRNVYDDPDYKDIVSEMNNELHKLREQYQLPPNTVELD